MTFVYENPIPEADFEKYGLKAVDDLFNRYTCRSGRHKQWVIDRERDMYLREMSDNGREHAESGGETPLVYNFTFYWHGLLMEIGVCVDMKSPDPNTRTYHWWIGRGGLFTGGRPLPAPDVLMRQDPELLADIKLALIAFSYKRPVDFKPVKQVSKSITIDF